MKGYPGLYSRKLKSGRRRYYIDVQHSGRRYHECLGVSNLEDARKAYLERRREIEAGVPRGSKRTLDDLLQLYVSSLPGKNEGHRKEVRKTCAAFLKDSGTTEPGDLSGEAALEWLLKRKSQRTGKKLAPRTRDKLGQHLRAFSRFLVKAGRLTNDPLAMLPRWGTHEDEQVDPARAPNLAELGQLLEHSPPYRQVVYLVAALTGLRRQELRKLIWADVNFAEGWVRLRARTTKNRKKVKHHPLLPEAVAVLVELQAGRVDYTDHNGRTAAAYVGAKTGPSDRVFVAIPEVKTLERDLERAGIPIRTEEGRIKFHSLRGAFATVLEESGVGLSTAQKLMRHSDPRLTANVYQKASFRQLSTALRSVSGPAAQLLGVVSGVVNRVGIQPSERAGMGAYEHAPEAPLGTPGASQVLAGATRNRNERPSCSLGPTVLKTVTDTSPH